MAERCKSRAGARWRPGALLVAGLALAAGAPGVSADADVPAVTVRGIRAVEVSGHVQKEFRSYSHYKYGLDEFEDFHAMAPAASLKFWLHPVNGDETLDTVKVQIEARDYVLPLPLEQDGTFVVPLDRKASALNAEVVVNRLRVERIMWGLVVRSPGLPANAYRLGDLRLECHVYQAIRAHILSRDIDPTSGPTIKRICDRPDRLWINSRPHEPVRGFILSHQGERETFDTGYHRIDKSGVDIRLRPRGGRDRVWPDDTLLEFIPAGGPGPDGSPPAGRPAEGAVAAPGAAAHSPADLRGWP